MRVWLAMFLLGMALPVAGQGPHEIPDAPEQYSRIAIQNTQQETIRQLELCGIDLHCGARYQTDGQSRVLELECSQRELVRINERHIAYQVLIPNLTRFYAERAQQDLQQARDVLEANKHLAASQRNPLDGCSAAEFNIPRHFTLGDYAGFLRYNEILAVLDSMASEFPQLISTRQVLSENLVTHQGRSIYWVRISNHPYTDEDEPEVLYTAMTHAREPASTMSLLYYMWYLLENYATNPRVQKIVDHTQLYFIPVLNPDGYLYNEEIAPEGGGMWRKNLCDNDQNSIINDADGVDLNRNFGYLWGYDDLGSSPDPAKSTYRGAGPFSEPETQMLREFVLAHDFSIAMHDHSYGDDLYHAWEFGAGTPLPDDGAYYRFSDLMSWNNRYHFGETYDTYWLGAINGGANDWFYGDRDDKKSAFSWIPEMGSVFWPDPMDIAGICGRQLEPHLLAAEFADEYARMYDLSVPSLHYGSDTLLVRVENLGLKPGQRSLELHTTDTAIQWYTIQNKGRLSFSYPLQTTEMQIVLYIAPSATDGSIIDFDLVLSGEDGIITTLPVSKHLEARSQALPAALWGSDHWGITQDKSIPGKKVLTDSPEGNMANALVTTEFTAPIDLKNVSWAQASFLAKWSIETTFDFVQLQARIPGGKWTPLCGQYTKPGAPGSRMEIPSPFAGQPEGEPVYDGRQDQWVREVVDLDAFIGFEQVELRFVAWSGAYLGKTCEDGFYMTDFAIITSRLAHCSNGVQDAGETGVDCGGPDCASCPTCADGIQNGDEEGIDCGGADCVPCATCTDGIMNGDEEGVDCGGSSCDPCPTCSDGIQDGDETGIDCGGPGCAPCAPTCDDGIMNGDEEGIDCGGSCGTPCHTKCCEKENKIGYQNRAFAILITPNPAYSWIHLAITDPHASETTQTEYRYEIFDLNGIFRQEGIWSTAEEQIDISDLPYQLYVIRVTSTIGQVTFKRFLKVQGGL